MRAHTHCGVVAPVRIWPQPSDWWWNQTVKKILDTDLRLMLCLNKKQAAVAGWNTHCYNTQKKTELEFVCALLSKICVRSRLCAVTDTVIESREYDGYSMYGLEWHQCDRYNNIVAAFAYIGASNCGHSMCWPSLRRIDRMLHIWKTNI